LLASEFKEQLLNIEEMVDFMNEDHHLFSPQAISLNNNPIILLRVAEMKV